MTARKTKVLSIALSVLLVLVLVPSMALAADFSDTSSHWGKEAIDTWANYGVLDGYEDGTFQPNGNMTRAELAKVINGVIGYQVKATNSFSDVTSTNWFEDHVLKLNAAGVMQGSSNTLRPNDKITRQEAAVMIARAFAIDESTGSSSFSDASSIASWASGLVNGMQSAGYIQGSDNRFSPNTNITRAEVVTILDNMIDAYYQTAGEYGEDTSTAVNGNVVVSAAGITIKNMAITGNLYLTDGIASGDVTVKGSSVAGKTLVWGGGGSSDHFDNCKLNELIVNRNGSAVRVVLSNGTTVTLTGVYENDILEVQNGIVVTRAVLNKGAVLDVKSGGRITTVDVQGDSEVANAGTITTMNVDAPVNVTGTGTLTTANVNVDGAVFAKAPTNLKLASGVSATVAGKVVTASTTTTGGGGGGTGGTTTVAVTGVTLSDSNLGIVVGGSKTLTATVLPSNASNKKVTWSSSNDAVATVSSTGVVTGVTVGTATITVTSAYSGSFTDTCVVAVVSEADYNTAGVAVELALAALKSPIDYTVKATTEGNLADARAALAAVEAAFADAIAKGWTAEGLEALPNYGYYTTVKGYIDAIDLAAAKADKKLDVDAAVSALTPADYTTESWGDFIAAIDVINGEIEALTTVDAVDAYDLTAKLDAAKALLVTVLDDLKATVKAHIDTVAGAIDKSLYTSRSWTIYEGQIAKLKEAVDAYTLLLDLQTYYGTGAAVAPITADLTSLANLLILTTAEIPDEKAAALEALIEAFEVIDSYPGNASDYAALETALDALGTGPFADFDAYVTEIKAKVTGDASTLGDWTADVVAKTATVKAAAALINAKTDAKAALAAAQAAMTAYTDADGAAADQVYYDLATAIGTNYDTVGEIDALTSADLDALVAWTANVVSYTEALEEATVLVAAKKAAVTAFGALSAYSSITDLNVTDAETALAAAKQAITDAIAAGWTADGVENFANYVNVATVETNIDNYWLTVAAEEAEAALDAVLAVTGIGTAGDGSGLTYVGGDSALATTSEYVALLDALYDATPSTPVNVDYASAYFTAIKTAVNDTTPSKLYAYADDGSDVFDAIDELKALIVTANGIMDTITADGYFTATGDSGFEFYTLSHDSTDIGWQTDIYFARTMLDSGEFTLTFDDIAEWDVVAVPYNGDDTEVDKTSGWKVTPTENDGVIGGWLVLTHTDTGIEYRIGMSSFADVKVTVEGTGTGTYRLDTGNGSGYGTATDDDKWTVLPAGRTIKVQAVAGTGSTLTSIVVKTDGADPGTTLTVAADEAEAISSTGYESYEIVITFDTTPTP